jgi:NAD+ diphosphatase
MSDNKKYFIFVGSTIFLQKYNNNLVPLEYMPPAIINDRCNIIHIGLHSGCLCVAIELASFGDMPSIDGVVSLPLKSSFAAVSDLWFYPLVKSYHLLDWDKKSKYCSQCGGSIAMRANAFEKVCSSCELSFFPRISPSIIVLIKSENKILLARSAHFAAGIYGLIAGFVEPGETLEQAVHREVYEEVGLKVDNLCYFRSQPWPFPDSLVIGFTADYAGGNISFLDGEIAEAAWYGKDDMPGRPSSSVSIASDLIDSFILE